MNKFELVKHYYERNLWTEEQVYKSVNKWISAEQYFEITGKKYE